MSIKRFNISTYKKKKLKSTSYPKDGESVKQFVESF